MSFLELIRPRKSLSALQAPEPLLLLKMFSYHMARVRLGIKIRVAFAAAAGLGSLFFRKWTRRNAGWIVSHFFVRLEMISQGLFVVWENGSACALDAGVLVLDANLAHDLLVAAWHDFIVLA